MCVPEQKSPLAGGKKQAPGSAGARLDKAQRLAASTQGGGTRFASTILNGVPKNTDVDAIRKNTLMGV